MENNIFRKEYRKLEVKEVERMNNIKDVAFLLYQMIEDSGSGRYQAIAKTKLEEVVMFAVKGMTE